MTFRLFGQYSDVTMNPMPSQMISMLTVWSTVCSGAHQENIKTPRHWPLRGEPPVTIGFPSHRASNVENASIWLRHHAIDNKLGQNLLMMTSSNGNIFRVTGHLCGEFTGDRWNYIREWDDIYKAFAQYIYSIYKTRAELYMPKNWDPQNEPAKSDCVITFSFFVLICVYMCVFLWLSYVLQTYAHLQRWK